MNLFHRSNLQGQIFELKSQAEEDGKKLNGWFESRAKLKKIMAAEEKESQKEPEDVSKKEENEPQPEERVTESPQPEKETKRDKRR
jgi:hypothetical protein